MICPQCAARNPLGSTRCRTCARPFTRDAYRARMPPARRSARQPAEPPGREPAWPATADAPLFERTRAWQGQVAGERPRASRKRRGALIALGLASVVVVGTLVVLLLASAYVVKPIVREAAVADLRAGVRDEVSTQIATQIADAPAGEVVITDDEINQRLDDAGQLGPIDDLMLTITPEGLVVDLSAYGLSGTYQSVIRVENGAVVLDRGSLDGPLALVIPNGELADAANAEIAAALSEAGYRVESATMQAGAIVLAVSQ